MVGRALLVAVLVFAAAKVFAGDLIVPGTLKISGTFKVSSAPPGVAFRRWPTDIWGFAVTVKPPGVSILGTGTLGAGNWPQLMVNGHGQADPAFDPDLIPNWIKPQIDYGAAAGANACQFYIGVEAIWNHGMSKSALLANVAEICDYIVSKHMYPCIAISINEGTASANFVAQDCADIIGTAAAHGMQFGDIGNELGTIQTGGAWTSTQFTQNINLFINKTRIAAPNIALSVDIFEDPNYTDDPTRQFLPQTDLLNFHDYVHETDGSAITTLYSLPGTAGKKFYVGEFGKSTAAGSSARTTYVNNMIANIFSDSRGVGSLWWATVDQDPGALFGAFDFNGTARTDVTTPYNTVTHGAALFPLQSDSFPPTLPVSMAERWVSLAAWTDNTKTYLSTINPGLNSDHDKLQILGNGSLNDVHTTATDTSWSDGTVTFQTDIIFPESDDTVFISFGGYFVNNTGGSLSLGGGGLSQSLGFIMANNTQYRVFGNRNGATVQYAIQRRSDGKYLNSSGTYVSSFAWLFNATDSSPASTGNSINIAYTGTSLPMYFGSVYAGPVGTPTTNVGTSVTVARNATQLVYPTKFTGSLAPAAIVSGLGTWNEITKTYTAPNSATTATLRFTGDVLSGEIVDVTITVP
jgi:hypothetical protein